MADDQPIPDAAVHDRLVAAAAALGEAPGSTVRGDTALQAARRALALLQWGLVAAQEAQERQNDPAPPVTPGG